MNKCKNCGNASLSKLVIFTETTFGHGDSSHKTYVKCTDCGNTAGEIRGYGLFEDKDLRLAQQSWNVQNPQ